MLTDAEFTERVKEIVRERGRGFQYDALELEVSLWRELAAEAHGSYWEGQGGAVTGLLRRMIVAHRGLAY